jgi:hypothetical protein
MTVEFSRESAPSFIKAYNKAVNADAKEFKHDDREWVTSYAYYVIQYLEMQKIIIGTFDAKKHYTLKTVKL